ncbi:MAG: cell division protein FtsB [Chromatiaceae bacterium]|nr:cell division protein FtsB [Chromatiaceae bacterium]MBP7983574.1 cell division protein FtsB [Chromatiaceae bacterium]MBP9605015.1 cell division protein FtsB [Chromatiaceae bacterium]
MRILILVLLLLLGWFQYRLWVGEGSLAEVTALRREILAQGEEMEKLRTRNRRLQAEVEDLRQGRDALEERARSELGMIKEGEIFLQLIEPQSPVTVAREEGKVVSPAGTVKVPQAASSLVPKPAPKPESKPEVKSESRPASKPEVKSGTKPAPKPEAKSAAKPKPKPDPKPAAKSVPKPESKPAPKPDPKPAPKSEPKPAAKPESKSPPKSEYKAGD